MDKMNAQALNRAQSALKFIAGSGERAQAKQLARALQRMALSGHSPVDLSREDNPLLYVERATTGATTMTNFGNAEHLPALCAAFAESVAEFNIVDALAAAGAKTPGINVRRVLVASGASADTAAEGAPKAIGQLSLTIDSDAPKKTSSIAVTSDEVLRLGGDAAAAMFMAEVQTAATAGINRAVLDWLGTPGSTVTATADPLADMRSAFHEAGPSAGYVVAADAGLAADLATRAEALDGFTVRGGEFRPGIRVVAVDGLADSSGPSMVIIPASRLAVVAWQWEVMAAGQASIEMSDAPTGDADTAPTGKVVNLWQNNLAAIRAERAFWLGGDTSGLVEVS